VEIRHGDRGLDREPGDSPDDRAAAILRGSHRSFVSAATAAPTPQDAAQERSGEEPRLTERVAKDGANHGAEAGERPGSEERGDGLQGNSLGSSEA